MVICARFFLVKIEAGFDVIVHTSGYVVIVCMALLNKLCNVFDRFFGYPEKKTSIRERRIDTKKYKTLKFREADHKRGLFLLEYAVCFSHIILPCGKKGNLLTFEKFREITLQHV